MSNLISQLQTKEGAFNYLQTIINEIKEGKRTHDQTNFHTATKCGTAHCIAGWLEHDVKQSIGIELDQNDYVKQYSNHSYYYHMDNEFERAEELETVLNKYFDEEVNKLFQNSFDNHTSVWAFAEAVLRTEDLECLFDENLSIEEIEENLIQIMKR